MNFLNESMFSSGFQKVLLIIIFAVLFWREAKCAYRENDKETVMRSKLLNLKIFLFNDLAMSLLSVSSLLIISDSFSHFGPLNLIRNGATKVLFIFVLYDFMLYWIHRFRHGFGFLWKFHKVHHSDFDMNASTTFRLHIVDVLITTFAKALFIIIIGVPMYIFAFAEFIVTSIVMLNHTNITFRGEQLLSYVFIVPFKHRVHHSNHWEEHESNFGFALSIWDAIFDTCQKGDPEDLGLKGIIEPNFFQAITGKLKRKSGKE